MAGLGAAIVLELQADAKNLSKGLKKAERSVTGTVTSLTRSLTFLARCCLSSLGATLFKYLRAC